MLEVSPDFFDCIDPFLLKISERVVKQTEAKQLTVKQIQSIYRALVNKYELTEDELMFANLIFNDCVVTADGLKSKDEIIRINAEAEATKTKRVYKTKPGTPISCCDHLGNHFSSISEMATYYCLDYRTLYHRLQIQKLSIDKALSSTDITMTRFNDRISRGWSKEDALNIPWMSWENGND